MKIVKNPVHKQKLQLLNTADDFSSDFLKLDQTTPQTTVGGFRFPALGINKAASADNGIEVLNKSGKQGLRIQNPAATDIAFSTYVTGDNFVRFTFLGDGMQKFASGTAGPDTVLYRSAANTLKVDSNGVGGTAHLITTGNNTANSFVKSGGTSSQFLKADGSVDSTTYLDTTTAGTTYLKLDQTTPQTIINGQPIQNTLTASQIVATDANKKLQTLAVATYPSLTELSYVKGLSSAVQTQINALPTASSTTTFTNKRYTKRVLSAASASSVTPEISTYDIWHYTALAADITFNNHSTSTPTNGERIQFRLLDNGTARQIYYGTNYVAKAGIPLPLTTVISKNLTMMFEWNSNLSKYNLIAVGQED